MTKQEVLTQLQDIFNSIFLDDVKVTENLSASEVPEWDSLTHISLVVAVESHFGVRFKTGEVETTKNVGDFADLILRHAASK